MPETPHHFDGVEAKLVVFLNQQVEVEHDEVAMAQHPWRVAYDLELDVRPCRAMCPSALALIHPPGH
jgi:hypothetical protein